LGSFDGLSNANIKLSGPIQSVTVHIASVKLMEKAIEKLPKLSGTLSLGKSSR